MKNPIIIFYFVYLFFKRFFHKSQYINLRKWKRLHNKYQGKRAFLIGNGPSLNQTPLYLLKDEFTLTFNHFDLLLERINWNPSAYMLVDAIVAQDSEKEIQKMIEISEYSFFPDFHIIDQIDFTKFIPRSPKVYFMIQIPKLFYRFSTLFPLVSLGGGTVVYDGFQVLAYLGFSEIYFLCVDMNYRIHNNTNIIKGNTIQSKEDDDPNHFDKRYFGKGRKYHQPTELVVAKMLSGLSRVKDNLDNLKITTYNVGYNSEVASFEKKDFYEVLGYNDKKILSLFEDLISKYNFNSLNDLNKHCLHNNTINDWNDNIIIQSFLVDVAIQLIKSKIHSHLPLGPYEGKIYFIKRNI